MWLAVAVLDSRASAVSIVTEVLQDGASSCCDPMVGARGTFSFQGP